MPAATDDLFEIVKTTFSTDGVIQMPPLPGETEPQWLNLFQAAKCAYRFEADTGDVVIVPMDLATFDSLDDPETDARAMGEAQLRQRLGGGA